MNKMEFQLTNSELQMVHIFSDVLVSDEADMIQARLKQEDKDEQTYKVNSILDIRLGCPPKKKSKDVYKTKVEIDTEEVQPPFPFDDNISPVTSSRTLVSVRKARKINKYFRSIRQRRMRNCMAINNPNIDECFELRRKRSSVNSSSDTSVLADNRKMAATNLRWKSSSTEFPLRLNFTEKKIIQFFGNSIELNIVETVPDSNLLTIPIFPTATMAMKTVNPICVSLLGENINKIPVELKHSITNINQTEPVVEFSPAKNMENKQEDLFCGTLLDENVNKIYITRKLSIINLTHNEPAVQDLLNLSEVTYADKKSSESSKTYRDSQTTLIYRNPLAESDFPKADSLEIDSLNDNLLEVDLHKVDSCQVLLPHEGDLQKADSCEFLTQDGDLCNVDTRDVHPYKIVQPEIFLEKFGRLYLQLKEQFNNGLSHLKIVESLHKLKSYKSILKLKTTKSSKSDSLFIGSPSKSLESGHNSEIFAKPKELFHDESTYSFKELFSRKPMVMRKSILRFIPFRITSRVTPTDADSTIDLENTWVTEDYQNKLSPRHSMKETEDLKSSVSCNLLFSKNEFNESLSETLKPSGTTLNNFKTTLTKPFGNVDVFPTISEEQEVVTTPSHTRFSLTNVFPKSIKWLHTIRAKWTKFKKWIRWSTIKKSRYNDANAKSGKQRRKRYKYVSERTECMDHTLIPSSRKRKAIPRQMFFLDDDEEIGEILQEPKSPPKNFTKKSYSFVLIKPILEHKRKRDDFESPVLTRKIAIRKEPMITDKNSYHKSLVTRTNL